MRLNRERDLEKMKRDWQDQQQLQQQLQQQQQQREPATPVPPTEPPSPSPSSSPARPEPTVTPLRNINVVPDALPSTPPSPDLRSSTTGSPASVWVSRVLPPQAAPVQDRGAEPPQRKEIPSA